MRAYKASWGPRLFSPSNSSASWMSFKPSRLLIESSWAGLSNTYWGSASRGCQVARSSRSLGWCAPAPPASALSPALPPTWIRSCWACVRIAGAAAPTDPTWCPSPSPSRWNRRKSRRGALVSWQGPADGAGSRCDRRSGPPGRRVWGRGPNTRRRRRRAPPSPGGLFAGRKTEMRSLVDFFQKTGSRDWRFQTALLWIIPLDVSLTLMHTACRRTAQEWIYTASV